MINSGQLKANQNCKSYTLITVEDVLPTPTGVFNNISFLHVVLDFCLFILHTARTIPCFQKSSTCKFCYCSKFQPILGVGGGGVGGGV